MMRTEDGISGRQLAATGFVLMLSPALRLFPAAAAAWAGKGVWLSALLAFPPAALYLWLFRRLAEKRRAGEGLGELIARAAPGRAGRMALLMLTLWLCVYAGFVLRSGADRFLVTVYPNTPPAFFILTMLLAALLASLIPLRAAARTAGLFLAPIAPILTLVLLAALPAVRKGNLLPLSPADLPGVLGGTLAALDVLLWAIGAAAILLPGVRRGGVPYGRLLSALAAACGVLALLGADTVGSFGAALTQELSWPFFSLVRNLVFFRSIERVEALVVALWVFPDFLIAALFLRAARHALSLSLGRRWPLFADRQSASALCAGAAAAFALLAVPDGKALTLLSGTVIPGVSLFFALAFFPALLGLGRLRGRI